MPPPIVRPTINLWETDTCAAPTLAFERIRWNLRNLAAMPAGTLVFSFQSGTATEGIYYSFSATAAQQRSLAAARSQDELEQRLIAVLSQSRWSTTTIADGGLEGRPSASALAPPFADAAEAARHVMRTFDINDFSAVHMSSRGYVSIELPGSATPPLVGGPIDAALIHRDQYCAFAQPPTFCAPQVTMTCAAMLPPNAIGASVRRNGP